MARNVVSPEDPVGGVGQEKARPRLQNGYAMSLDK